MEKLSIEEKAKRYDKVVEMAKSWHIDSQIEFKKSLETLFPELAESEDERIRKRIIHALHGDVLDMEETTKAIAYLEKQSRNPYSGVSFEYNGVSVEKQGEQKAIDNLTPQEAMDIAVDKCFNEQKPIDKVEPKFKVGDTIVEKDLDECGYGTIKDIKDGQYIFTNGSGMNINEQEGWQLVKTSTNIEQKPAWSEEDENRINRLITYFEDEESFTAEDDIVYANWLKSLKVRYTWKPSEEMLEALYRAIPENVTKISDDEMLLDKLYQGLKYGRVLSKN